MSWLCDLKTSSPLPLTWGIQERDPVIQDIPFLDIKQLTWKVCADISRVAGMEVVRVREALLDGTDEITVASVAVILYEAMRVSLWTEVCISKLFPKSRQSKMHLCIWRQLMNDLAVATALDRASRRDQNALNIFCSIYLQIR